MYDNRRQSSFKNSSSSHNKMSSSSSSLLVDYSRGKGTSVRRGLEENNREYQRRNKLTTNLTLSMRSILMDDESIHSITDDELSQSHHHQEDKTPITFRIRKRQHPMNRALSCPRSMNDEATTARAARGNSRLTQSATAALQNKNNNNGEDRRRSSSMRRSRSSDDAMMMMNGLDRNSSHHDRFTNSIMMRNQQLDLSNPTHRGRSPSAVPLGLQKNPLQKSSHSSRSLSPATRKPMINSTSSHRRQRSRSPLSKSKSIQSLETNNSNHSRQQQQQQRRRAGLERSLSYQNYNYNSSGSSKSLLSSSLSSRSLSPKRCGGANDSLDNISNHCSSSTLHQSAPSMVFAKGDSFSSLNHCSSNHFVTGSRIRRHHTGGSRVQPHAVGA